MPAVWHCFRGREEYFETGVEEEPQRSESKRYPLGAGPQKQLREDWGWRQQGRLETGFQKPTHDGPELAIFLLPRLRMVLILEISPSIPISRCFGSVPGS